MLIISHLTADQVAGFHLSVLELKIYIQETIDGFEQ